jgi:hypothetical protein
MKLAAIHREAVLEGSRLVSGAPPHTHQLKEAGVQENAEVLL